MESMALIDWYRQSQKKLLLQRVLSHSLSTNISLFPRYVYCISYYYLHFPLILPLFSACLTLFSAYFLLILCLIVPLFSPYFNHRFGKMLFFEYPLTNPFGHEERFIIEIPTNETELKLIIRTEEWIYCRNNIHKCYHTLSSGGGGGGGDSSTIEADMFDRDTQGHIQVTLLAHETVYLPYAFLSLTPMILPTTTTMGGNTTTSMHNEEVQKQQQYESNTNNQSDTYLSIAQRSITVKAISASHGHIIAVLNLNIYPRPFVTHRTIRYYETESSIAKRRVKAIAYDTSGSSFPVDSSGNAKYIHCVEYTTPTTGGGAAGVGGAGGAGLNRNNVVVEWRESSSAVTEFLVRYRCGMFPQSIQFFVLMYDDPYQCKLREVCICRYVL